MSSASAPAPRTPLCLEVSYRKNYGRTDLVGTLKNISTSGAFLEVSHENLGIDEKIYMTFVVGDRERKISAQIVWKNALGAGVKFLPANNRDVQIIDDLIYYVESRRIGHRGILDGIFKKVS